ncbi:PEP/pyruvate-binding domain-containing protein [Desulfopila aestuarii]|uniref:Phosphoenolpyruvate synthase n=1 Tax=Desulfopila aestuarii DSM 18488 TaxID=1121416 RepID=A0A1M7YJ16_9BACT|nr:PEP/pyruvate-binding domain-containing protein [Desulfopila aestuarii]SHO52571.1 pyruvate, water dikinase [Desulfopila aestuarii DSM 18488]
MKLIYSPESDRLCSASLIGGKGAALFKLYDAGIAIPSPLCVSTEVYRLFVKQNGLGEKVAMALGRKDLQEIRWEEIWDISLTIRNLFLRAEIPAEIEQHLHHQVFSRFGDVPLVVRSSASTEDGGHHSYAGMHSSLVNIRYDNLVLALKKVWASLWSDRAILYRQELGLDAMESTMAVVIQPLVIGDVSGILFSKDPTDSSRMVIEAVYGLNQGLIDGAVAPDRWLIDHSDKTICSHFAPEKRMTVTPVEGSSRLQLRECNDWQQQNPPLQQDTLHELVAMSSQVEHHLGAAIDIEWTFAEGKLFLLQARPITTRSGDGETDKRSWYLSLTRSYENLKALRETIENELLPSMQADSERLEKVRLDELSPHELANEISERSALNTQYTSAYWQDCIPFAHGVRLFGEIYNDLLSPDDPFAFVRLLSGQHMLGIERNELLWLCARKIHDNPSWMSLVRDGRIDLIEDNEIQTIVAKLKKGFAIGFVEAGDPGVFPEILSAILLQFSMLHVHPRHCQHDDDATLVADFLVAARDAIPMDPAELLDLARASYRIRDDDNIYLGRIGQEVERALAEARKRVSAAGVTDANTLSAEELSAALLGTPKKTAHGPFLRKPAENRSKRSVFFRQLQGQAASQGIATGQARVIDRTADLKDFRKGEVLVIDAIDPTMTFFAPLASAIIERRGGMLIHGAIIAREYGIPCITGVKDATLRITTGDHLTVDGYLGICTIQSSRNRQ